MSINEMELREEIAKSIEAIPVTGQVTGFGMRILAAKVARGQ
jgi:hypothetical protein